MSTTTDLLVLTDEAIRTRLQPRDALRWTEEALSRLAQGTLTSPPCVSADLGDGYFAFTVGPSGTDWYGYRAYDTRMSSHGEQLVVAHDHTTGQVVAFAIGKELGARRTGALGGVAAKHLTGGAPRHVAFIGTGLQAYTQAWAISGFTTPDKVTVHSRTLAARKRFAGRLRTKFGWEASVVADPRGAIDGQIW